LILCSTCHSVHFADSRSSTVDGSANFANLSSGDGYLLRTDRRGIDPGARNDSANICTNCHAGKKSHNMKGQDIQCVDCHGAHVEYDQDDPNGSKGININLIRRNVVTKDGHANGKKVFFRYTGSKKEYVTGDTTGICQSCHVVPAPDSNFGYPPEHTSTDPKVCNTCHFHNSTNGSFSGACTSCHGYPPTTTNGLIGYAGTDPKTGATQGNPGAHETHATLRHMACITCHTGYAAKAMPSNSIDIGFSINNGTYKNFVGTTAGGTFNGSTLNSGYTWSAASGTNLTSGNAAITCSVYCHGSTLSGGTATPPTWTTTDGSQKACGACHGVTPATAPVTGSHTRHAKDNAIACATCHGAHDNRDHVNGSVEWNFTALGGGTYKGAVSGATGTVAPSTSYGSCSNMSCHSSGQAADGSAAPLTYGSPAWGGTLTCGDCHKNMKTDTTAPGGHVKHAQAQNISCATCHNGYTETSVKTSTHTNGMVNLSFSGAATNAVYSQFSTHPLGNGYGTCSNVSCHSSPYGTTLVTTPKWGASACSGCHNGSVGPVAAFGIYSVPATGSHTKHLGIAGAQCNQCHSGAVAGSSGGSGHLNGSIDVTGGYPASVTKHAAGTYTGTCSTASCHADPYSASSVTSPVWGTVAGCAACHNGTGAFGANGAPATGSHDKHMSRALTCGDCHSGAVAGSSGGATHANGKVDVLNGYPANVTKHVAGTYTGGTCTTTCHSPTTTPVTTPIWGSQSTCSSCHESSPSTGSHPRHSGLSVGATCQDCHAGAVINSNAGTSHLNGTIDVTNGYPPNVAKHAANSYSGTCSTAACHGNPYGAGSVTTPVWGVAAGCAACHTGVGAFTGIGGGPATGSHNAHMALASSSCGQCHAGASTAFGGDNHTRNDIIVTGTIDVTNGYPVTVKHAANTGYTGYCSTAVCHGASSPIWGTNTVYNQCTKCHGTGTVDVTAANRHVVAPSDATATDTGKVSANPKIGAHQTHLQLFNGLSMQGTEDDRCIACHGSLPTSGTHANGSSTPVFQTLATKNGAFAASYSSGTCSVYCHNPAGVGGTLNSANTGTGVAPSWTNAAYIADGTLKTDANCNVCHKSPGNSGFTASVPHTFGIAQDCSGCHGHNGGSGGVIGQQHMDGIKYGGGSCDTCHGYPPLPSFVFNARAVGEYVNAKFQDYSGGGGHHSTHLLSTIVAADGFTPCLPCHPSGYHNQGSGTVLRSNVNVNDQADSGYRFDDNRAKRYNTASSTCSNVSCHFQPTPAW
jgi:predicted CxxxxCH...CXXCH cytochrome family protein